MVSLCGYNFMSDLNCLDPYPNSVENITSVKLQNGIFDHYNLTADVTTPYSSTIPTMWDFLTLMDANFQGNINAGNADFLLSSVSAIKIKRRIKGEFEWVTLKTYPVTQSSDLIIAFNDNLAANYIDYEYAYVPVLGNVEGTYIINSVLSNFEGVFLCDQESIYKFYADVSYGTMEQTRQVGVYEVFGKQYPIVTSNGKINYKKSSVTGKIMPTDYMNTRTLDRFNMVKNRDQLLSFLTNDKAKILKDWNGNFWLILIVDSPSVDFVNEWGMGLMNVSASWVEQGNPNTQADLVSNGILEG